MDDRELMLKAAGLVQLWREEEGKDVPELSELPNGIELRFSNDECALLLYPGDNETTTVEVRDATALDKAPLRVLPAGAREPEALATQIEGIYQGEAGPDA
jgi:hypothetical protein